MSDRRLPWALVVDDNEANRYAVGRTLRAAGFETSEASNGRQAIELAHTDPDVIVLDVNLPDINGFDVVRELRRDARTSLIPILHLSASYMRDEDRVHGLDNGANAYLTHPIEPAVFVATIRSLLRVKRLEEERAAATADWQATFDAISDVVCVVDASGILRRANRAAVETLGHGEEIIGKPWLDAMEREFSGIDAAALGRALKKTAPSVDEYPAGARWLRIALDPMATASRYEGSVVCVVSDITSRKAIEQERASLLAATENARTQAEQASSAKSDFLATMSHEIRTPINAILGYSQILDMGIAGSISDDQRRQLDRLRRSASHLLTLVSELLDLAKIESGDMRMDVRQFLVDEVLEDALAIARPQALARGIQITVAESKPPRLAFTGDSGRVRQILVNLLANAVKFSEAGSHIELSSELCEPARGTALDGERLYVAVEIRDFGIGISVEQQAEIFEPFVQGETGRTRTWGGSGVGLAISRRLARLMGGDLTVQSRLGEGSSFTLWIPSSDEVYLAATAEQPAAHRRSAPFDAPLLAQLGRTLTAESLTIATSLAVRLRSDSRFRVPPGLTDAQLIDHFPAYTTALGLALIAISEVGMEASGQLHDGNAIRHEVAERHGAQRRRLGWTEEQVVIEYDVAREEIEATLLGRSRSGEPLDGALDLIGRLIEQARAVTLRGFREAVATSD